ncbi:hypothetical protein H8K35_00330 [Undibacterium sp. LX40W]|uniref:Uncharacterized protein n=1 Tax=Undibacterium nitidum TaxID=2762298 RepID=A0A923HK81_9BURK|nr:MULTISPECIES: hypothetical protein [Undibacterium]MBC3881170.1 hypothetical protein [Undibacterium nitidum]MBC3890097.1 hypothetical protein [Undibacterium sp. LX40W]
MEKLSLATLLAMVASYIATFFVHLFIILQLLRFVREQMFLWALSRKWEISVGVFVVAFELRPELQEPHKQNMLALDFDQDAGNRVWSACESLLKMLNIT